MAETKKLATISVITDTENSYDYIGEVEGGFDERELENHIEKYGTDDLLKTLSYLHFQVFSAIRKRNGIISEQNNIDASKGLQVNN